MVNATNFGYRGARNVAAKAAVAQAEKPVAAYWLNFKVVGANNETKSLGKGIPLNPGGSQLEDALIAAIDAGMTADDLIDRLQIVINEGQDPDAHFDLGFVPKTQP